MEKGDGKNIPKERKSQNTGRSNRIDRLIEEMEKLHLSEYLLFQKDRKKRLWDAFFQGVLRGLGTMIGFAVLGTLLIMILKPLAQKNLPLISDFLAQVVTMVEAKIK